LKQTAELGRLPVVNFAAGGIATPADAALMMQLGCDGVFVGSGIFKSGNAAMRAKAIVQATTHYMMRRCWLSAVRGWARRWWASTVGVWRKGRRWLVEDGELIFVC